MTDKVKRRSAAGAAKSTTATSRRAQRAKTSDAKTSTTAAKRKTAAAKPERAAAQRKKQGTLARKVAPKHAAKAKEAKAKIQAPAVKKPRGKQKAVESPAGYRIGEPVLDPIGDVSSGEAHAYLGDAATQAHVEAEAYRADTTDAAMDSGLEAGPGLEATQAAREARARQRGEDAAGSADEAEESGDAESELQQSEPGRLERLQKILSQAGIASRRHAEEMIVAGRVMVNGQVVTQLGSKADAARDHIRVDGKLLHGAERHRYFMLNKPRGYVTTVSDPEGRPTVMQFFAKMHERLYPVGRLDFQSEGLLLMSNDGELANLLTKAESGVEKTYLVKVAGQPSEDELQKLRGGVAIEKGEAGSERVRTSPVRVRQVRPGDNPWYEVVLIEGRNRELRKMFAAIGHFAEKIRRVGYGPLVLDVEPGRMRELTLEEVNSLRLTAEGKMKPRRVSVDRMLPKDAGRTTEKREERPRGKSGVRRFDGRRGEEAFGRRDRAFGTDKRQSDRSERGIPHPKSGTSTPRTETSPRGPRTWGAQREFGSGEKKRAFGGEGQELSERPRQERGEKRFKGGRPQFGGRRSDFGERREGQRSFGSKPKFDRPRFERKDFGGGRIESGGQRREFRGGPRREFGSRPGRKEGQTFGSKPRFERPQFEKPEFGGGRSESGGQRREFRGGPRREFGSGPRREGSERRFEGGARKPFKPRGGKPQLERGERPPFERSERPRFEQGGERPRKFEGGGGNRFGKGGRSGAKVGGSGGFRGRSGGGRKFGGSRPGGQRGGWKPK